MSEVGAGASGRELGAGKLGPAPLGVPAKVNANSGIKANAISG